MHSREAERSVTPHKISIGGATFSYSAMAGTLIVRDEKDQPYASIGYACLQKARHRSSLPDE